MLLGHSPPDDLYTRCEMRESKGSGSTNRITLKEFLASGQKHTKKSRHPPPSIRCGNGVWATVAMTENFCSGTSQIRSAHWTTSPRGAASPGLSWSVAAFVRLQHHVLAVAGKGAAELPKMPSPYLARPLLCHPIHRPWFFPAPRVLPVGEGIAGPCPSPGCC